MDGHVPSSYPETRRDGPPDRDRALRGFLLAPLAAPAAYAIILVAETYAGGTFGRGTSLSATPIVDLVLAIAMIGIPLSYVAAFVLGGPTYLFLRRLDAIASWTLWLGGAVIGAIVALLLAPSLRGELFSIWLPWWTGALLGLISAETFRRLTTTRIAPIVDDARGGTGA